MTKTPSSPMITLGTAASSSIRNVSAPRRFRRRQLRQKDRRAHAERDPDQQRQRRRDQRFRR